MILKKQVREKREMLTVKCTPQEALAIRDGAARYAGGNLSEWMRYAAIHHTPPKAELVRETLTRKK